MGDGTGRCLTHGTPMAPGRAREPCAAGRHALEQFFGSLFGMLYNIMIYKIIKFLTKVFIGLRVRPWLPLWPSVTGTAL